MNGAPLWPPKVPSVACAECRDVDTRARHALAIGLNGVAQAPPPMQDTTEVIAHSTNPAPTNEATHKKGFKFL